MLSWLQSQLAVPWKKAEEKPIEKDIVMAGLDSAGKSTFLYQWNKASKGREVDQVIPTIGFVLETWTLPANICWERCGGTATGEGRYKFRPRQTSSRPSSTASAADGKPAASTSIRDGGGLRGSSGSEGPGGGRSRTSHTYQKISYDKCVSWDVGGKDKIRPLWRHICQNANTIIWVVDTNDTERLVESADELFRLIYACFDCSVSTAQQKSSERYTFPGPTRREFDRTRLQLEIRKNKARLAWRRAQQGRQPLPEAYITEQENCIQRLEQQATAHEQESLAVEGEVTPAEAPVYLTLRTWKLLCDAIDSICYEDGEQPSFR